MSDLRVVIQVYDHATMQENHGSARVVLTEADQRLISTVTDQKIPQYIAEEIESILTCLREVAQ